MTYGINDASGAEKFKGSGIDIFTGQIYTDLEFYVAGKADVQTSVSGQLIRNDDDPGTLNSYLLPPEHPQGDYWISAAFRYGGWLSGAYDGDPNTWSFQQQDTAAMGDTLTQISGVFVPEPVTMASLLVGGAFLAAVRRRRLR